MLKLIKGEVPTGLINGVNTVFSLSEYIGYIDTIKVNGVEVSKSLYSFSDYQISLTTAPTTSIVVDYFYREQLGMKGNGEVSFGDLISDVYSEIGRQEYSDIYKRDRVEAMVNKSAIRLFNKVSEKERIQTYSLEGYSGLRIQSNTLNPTTIATGTEDEGLLIIKDNIVLPYYSEINGVFDVGIDYNLFSIGDKALIGHRMPYGVKKVSTLYIDGLEYEYIDERSFKMETSDRVYTIIKTEFGNEYIFIPYTEKYYLMTVKFIPDTNVMMSEVQYVDIPYEYTQVIVYDVVYKILASREDERSIWYERQTDKLYREYSAFTSNKTKRTKTKIGIAKTYGETPYSPYDY